MIENLLRIKIVLRYGWQRDTLQFLGLWPGQETDIEVIGPDASLARPF